MFFVNLYLLAIHRILIKCRILGHDPFNSAKTDKELIKATITILVVGFFSSNQAHASTMADSYSDMRRGIETMTYSLRFSKSIVSRYFAKTSRSIA